MKTIKINGVIIPNDYRDVYDYFGIEATCPTDVSEALEEAKGKAVLVEINSSGGDMFSGSEIYTALSVYKGRVLLRVTGVAASAASIILCAGESEITPTGMVMIHNAALTSYGDHNEHDHVSGMLKSADRSVAAAYIAKTGKAETEILAAMNKETWMSSAEAVEFGIVDRVLDTQSRLAAGVGLLPAEVVSRVRALLDSPTPTKARDAPKNTRNPAWAAEQQRLLDEVKEVKFDD